MQERWDYPGLSARAWHEPRDYPFTKQLERNAPIISKELAENWSEIWGSSHPMASDLAAGEWDACFLYSVGEKREACALFPRTTRIVEAIPGATRAGLIYFSVLGPGGRVKPHAGPTNTRIRCHLGLITPERAWLRVGAETRVWQAGKCLLFDDSFIHESANESREPRAVLVVDVWHPELGRAQRKQVHRWLREDLERRRQAERRPGDLARAGAFRAFSIDEFSAENPGK